MSKPKVLVVDDEKAICSFVQYIIEDKGFGVVLAYDGVQALEALEKNKDIKLIISDVMMPNMTGIELLEKVLKNFTQVEDFYFMTGFSSVDEEVALKLGAKGLLTKPLDLSLIEGIIAKLD